MNIPSNFVVSLRSPTPDELESLSEWLKKNATHKNDILEFGSGVTSYITHSSIRPYSYTCVEQIPICIDSVRKYNANINIVPTWDLIPRDKLFDFVLVDGSTGAPKDLPLLEGTIPFRDDAIKYALPYCHKDVWICVHDWCWNYVWQRPRRYLEAQGWKMIWSYKGKYGWGVYTK